MVPHLSRFNYQFPRESRSVAKDARASRLLFISIESVQARKSCTTWRNESCTMLSAFCGLGLFPLYWNIRPQHYGNYQGNGMSASGSHEGAEGGFPGRGRSGKRGRPCVETDSCRSRSPPSPTPHTHPPPQYVTFEKTVSRIDEEISLLLGCGFLCTRGKIWHWNYIKIL